MAVIKEIKNGSGGVIRIHDDYCKNNTPEDNQKIIDNVSRIVNDYYITVTPCCIFLTTLKTLLLLTTLSGSFLQ